MRVVDIEERLAEARLEIERLDVQAINAALARVPSPTPLLPADIPATLPPLGTTADLESAEFDHQLARVKFFTPAGGWTWFALEYDPDSRIFWGYVESGLDSNFDEFGSFSLDELESLGGRVERDLHFEPTAIGVIVAARGRY